MKKFIFIAMVLLLCALPCLAQTEQNSWQSYESPLHQSACNPTMMAQASGMIHVTQVASVADTGRVHISYNFNLKGVGMLVQNDIPIASFRVQLNDNIREVDLPAISDPIDLYETYRMRIEVTHGDPAVNYYEQYTFRYHVTPNLQVTVFLESDQLVCK